MLALQGDDSDLAGRRVLTPSLSEASKQNSDLSTAQSTASEQTRRAKTEKSLRKAEEQKHKVAEERQASQRAADEAAQGLKAAERARAAMATEMGALLFLVLRSWASAVADAIGMFRELSDERY